MDVCEGAKKEGFSTLVVSQRGREKTYLGAYGTRKRGDTEVGVVDLDKPLVHGAQKPVVIQFLPRQKFSKQSI